MRTRRYKILLGILAAVYISSTAVPAAVFATPQQIGTLSPPQQEPKRGINPETGKVSFIGGGNPITVPGVSTINGMAPQNRAMGLVNAYGREFGLADPARELRQLTSRKDDNGNDLVRYQQVYNGVPIVAGEMIVNMNSRGQLLSVSGEVSSGLMLDTNPAITAPDAEKTALGKIAKLHQIDEAQLTTSSPELWIFDESLLTASTRPVELVWRMEVTAKDAPRPIRELVLVNAKTGEISFHVNRVHTESAEISANPAATSCSIVNGTASPSLFLPYKQYNCGLAGYGVAAGDFNNDGRQDVALSADAPGTGWQHNLLIFLQDSSGNLSAEPGVYVGGSNARPIAAGDLNHDGLDDVVTADIYDNQISVFLQKTDGTLADRVTYLTGAYSVPENPIPFPDGIAVGDVNGDEFQDVVISHANSAVIGVFTQKSDGTLNTMRSYPSLNTGRNEIAIGDVNNDGRNDVVKMNVQIEPGEFEVFLQNSSHTLNPRVTYSLSNCASTCNGHGIGIGDVTGDGRSDVVMTYGENQTYTEIAVFSQNASGGLQAPVAYPSNGVSYPVEVADVNSDLRMDVVTLQRLSAGVFLQQSNTSLGDESLYSIPLNSPYYDRGLSIGDVNNDGLPDLLIADEVGLTILYRNTTIPPTPTRTSAVTFTPTPTFTPGPGPSRTPGPTSTAGPSPTAVSPSSTGSRRTYTASGGITIPGTFLCDQSAATCTNGADVDADQAHRYAADTFVFYNTHHGRNSFDNQGGIIDSTVHFGVGYQNAFWDGYHMVYGDGMAADDVVGHEITHGVTQYTSNLIYSYQSGAINESLSDIWGEFIDQTNASGNDALSVKWLIGEDTPLGALRNMSDPTMFGDPDKMSSPYYYYGSADDGGVHFNSGVNNKAAYLMTDGGTFNGRTVMGIGLNKTAAVYYEAQANLLTAGSNYNDLYYALIQACQNLIGGSSGITQSDCNQVRTAAEAVEMVPAAPPPNQSLYLSLTSSQTIGGVASADEDILRFDGTNWSLYFDGSDVGVGTPDLFAFSFLDADTILMSFGTNVTLNGIAATPQDILRFDATSLGSTTAGVFSLYFDGSDVGLADATNEKIDSLSLLSDGQLLISATGNPVVPGVTGARDEDVLSFAPISIGAVTSGNWSLYFDGSDVGLGETSREDVDALDVAGGNIYLSTQGDFSVNGASGADEDVFVCAASSLGDMTACNYLPSLYFDGSTWGLDANDVDAFHFLASGPVPTAVPTNTPTQTPTALPGATNTPTSTPTTIVMPSQTPTNTATATATSIGGNTFTFIPLADAYVNAGSPTSNYGSSTALRADASPDLHSYLRFDVQGLSGSVTQATLRVYANSSSSLGCIANSVNDNTWSEATLNYNNAPPVGGALDSSGLFGANMWVDLDVTAYITGNGTYSLALTTTSSTAMSLASRESANAPQLIVTTAP